jgi:hypothetical protein
MKEGIRLIKFIVLVMATCLLGAFVCSAQLPAPGNDAARTGALIEPPPRHPGFDGRPLDPARPVVVRVLSPQNEELLTSPRVEVRIAVDNFALTPEGNRIQVVLDNRRSVWVYDLSQPVVFDDVQPGGHLLRVFAVGGDGVMRRDREAFIMGIFYVGTKSRGLAPGDGEPVLTASSPRGVYAGEASRQVLFDYDVHNAALSFDGYRVRFTINDIQNITAEPGPLILTRLVRGTNRLVAEIIDASGQRAPGSYSRIEVPFEIQRADAPQTAWSDRSMRPPQEPSAPPAVYMRQTGFGAGTLPPTRSQVLPTSPPPLNPPPAATP